MPAMACSVDPAGYAFAGDTALPDPSTDLDLDAHFVAGAGGCSDWSPSRSSELYRIDAWGAPYFAANSAGNISVRPHGAATLPHQDIDLMKVVKKVSDPRSDGGLGLEPPLIVRFPDVLKNRLESLQAAFDFAVQSQGYGSHYQGVYPVKCNQDRFIVEDVVKFGSSFRFGLEAGSKPELLLSMSCLCKGSSESLLICNGFKDAEYVALAIVARKLDLNTVIVLEQEEELDLVIDLSKKLSVRPVIGLRAKLRTKHSGHFGATSGEKGKFGLTAIQIVRVVRKLDRSGMLNCLRLLHFHIGSQIPSTALLADGVGEAAQIYCELVRLGAPMQVIDVGGGLGIDYDGSRSGDSDASVGYEIDDYASAVVSSIRLICDRKSVDHPVIVSESGRAIVSHHSILIFEAVSASSNSSSVDPPSMSSLPEDSLADYRNLTGAAIRGEYEACSAYADQMKQQCVEQFKDGSIAIEQLAAVDGLCELISRAIGSSNPVATYHINLSIFTSIPDFWAIGQLFPIVPVHRLQEQPQVRAILSDLTCDSDGKIDKFIGGESSLHLHDINAGRYYLGMFLGGAYQEALGGFHNLFGGPSVVRAVAHGPGGFTVTRAAPGPSCGDVLRVARHEPELMFRTLKDRVEECEGDAVVVAGLVSGLARSFQNMPYLAAAGSSCCLTGFDNGGYSCNDDDDDGGEEERWPYSYA